MSLTPTYDKDLTSAWELGISVTKTWFVVSLLHSSLVQAAVTADDTTLPAEGVSGHPLVEGAGLSRAIIPAGAIWFRRQGAAGNAAISITSD